MADQAKNERIPLRDVIRLHRRGAKIINKYSPGLFPAVTLQALTTALVPYVTVFFSARIIDELAGNRRPDVLWRWVIVTVLVEALLKLIQEGVNRWRDACKGGYSYFNVVCKVYTDHLLDMDYADLDKQETKDTYAQIIQNMSWNALGIYKIPFLFQNMLRGVFGVLGAVALTVGLLTARVPESAGRWALLNHPLALLGLLAVMALLVMLTSRWNTKGRGALTNEAMAEEAREGNRHWIVFGCLAYDLERALDIRMYSQQKLARFYMLRSMAFRVNGPADRLMKGSVGIRLAAAASLSAVITGVVYAYVCLKAWAGAFGVGAVTQYVSAITALMVNVAALFENVATLRSNVPFLKLSLDFLDMPNAMYQGSLTTEKRADRQYDVEFQDVSFRYPGSERYALRHASVKFKVGQRLAVVGENGSGKTTFIKLLCRLYDPEEGQILLNGIDIRKYDPKDYRDVFSVVFQDFQLLSQPLGANVAGSATYDQERALNSLKDAGFAQRLEELPEGLDTLLYQGFDGKGVTISGGEAQKIAIARALYKDAPFIVLDEPTAALDPMAEAEIYARFSQISGDRTAIYISHRLSSCRFCDEILVFHEGRIVQRGDHDSLLRDLAGKYYQLWHAQAQYYEQE